MKLTLPVPPSVNRYFRIWRNVAVKSAEARAYQARVQVLARAQGVRHPFRGPVAVTMHWYRGRKSGDLDNRLKCAQDSLNAIAWADDRQVVELHAYRHEDKANPRLEVEIHEVASAVAA